MRLSEALGLHQKLKFGRRAAVSSGKKFSKAKDSLSDPRAVFETSCGQPGQDPVPKTAQDMKLITQVSV